MNESAPSVRLVKEIPADPRRVFRAWLDPLALQRFMCPMQGASVPKAETDARVGGKFLVVMRIGEKDLPHHGEYLEIVPYERLVFTWLSHRASGNSRVTLTFEAIASGTRLTLEHRGLDDDSARRDHEHGWTMILACLASDVPGG
ncbi:MAG TPA: SRPBCC domain-containing protein [Polyangiaceae bacterium]